MDATAALGHGAGKGDAAGVDATPALGTGAGEGDT